MKLTKQEYQKLFQENKLLKERRDSIEKEKIVRKTARKRQCKAEMDNGEEEEQEEEDERESEPEEIRKDILKNKNSCSWKIREETKKETKTKPKKKKSKIFLNTLTKTKNAAGNQQRCKNRKFGNALSKYWKDPYPLITQPLILTMQT